MLLRVAMANEGPVPQADLLVDLSPARRRRRGALEARDRHHEGGRRRLTRPARHRTNVRTTAAAVRPGGDRAARPDPRVLPAAPTTRFAPAPTGRLHLGHLANALYVWGLARATRRRVILRIEDHDRQRSPPEYERPARRPRAAGARGRRAVDSTRFAPGRRRTASRDCGPRYAAALDRLRERRPRLRVRLLALDVRRLGASRSAVARARVSRRCRERAAPRGRRTRLRVALGEGDGALGRPARRADGRGRPRRRPAGPRPDGNWTYALCVVVDDLRHGIDLVIRGRDLLDATPGQLRLARLLGRETPPPFLHHPLVRRVSGRSYRSRTGDTAVRACSTRVPPRPSCSGSPPDSPASAAGRRRPDRTGRARDRCSPP